MFSGEDLCIEISLVNDTCQFVKPDRKISVRKQFKQKRETINLKKIKDRQRVNSTAGLSFGEH